MNAKSINWAALSAPPLAVLLAYWLFSCQPQQTQMDQLSASLNNQRSTLARLHQKLKTQVGTAALTNPVVFNGQESSDLAALKSSLEGSHDPLSPVQSVVKIIETFHDAGALCIGTDPVSDAAAGPSDWKVVVHRVDMTGDFGDVLTAWQSIEQEMPDTMATGFSMVRDQQESTCRWLFTFQWERETR